jgi:hypothetical protein
MEHSSETNDAVYFLTSLEKGTLPAAEVYQLSTDLDPVIVYWSIAYLRKKYPASHSSSAGVLQRLVELTTTYPDVIAKAKQGENDMVSEWFKESFSLNDFFSSSEEMMRLLVEKLEG